MPQEETASLPHADDAHLTLPDAQLSLHAAAQPGAYLKIHIEAQSDQQVFPQKRTLIFTNGAWQEQLSLRPRLAQHWQNFRTWLTWDHALFCLSLLVYLLTRLVRLADFPIYFFSDEAVQTLLASDLVRDGFKGYDSSFLPTFFPNANKYSLSTSVYLQLPGLLLGRSMWVTRATAALATLLAAVSLYLILKKIFHCQRPWLGILILAATPVWFLHSRTAFETTLAASFYAAFLYFYLRYRTDQPRHLYPAVIMAALAFYSYNPARVVVAVSAILLLASDLRYHWQQRKIVLTGLGLAALLALPYLRFQLTHPGESLKHLQTIRSYWFQPLPADQKLHRFASEYLQGLNPLYWYLPHDDEIPRHIMKGYGHLLWACLPLMLAGLGLSLRKAADLRHRALLTTLLAAPSGAALVGMGSTRAMIIVIPHVLLCSLALSAGLQWLEDRRKLPRLAVSLTVFGLLSAFCFWMLGDALINGPLWYQNYSLTGMQYGTSELFPIVQKTLEEHPELEISVSPSWANGSDSLARFMLGDPVPVKMETIYSYMDTQKDLPQNRLFVMTDEEYQTLLNSQKFTGIQVLRSLPYPNGQPAFHFIQLHYVDNIDQVFAAEQEALYSLQSSAFVWGGQQIEIRFQQLDMGDLQHIFDNNPETFIRSAAANPLHLQMVFPRPLTVSDVDVLIGGAPTNLTVSAHDANGSLLQEIISTFPAVPEPRLVSLRFAAPVQAAELHFVIENANAEQPSHVHIWELNLR